MTSPPTIIIPVYNGLPYLHEAIESVLAQEERSWRLVIADDGSTDGSRHALCRYKDQRIQVVHNPRNFGLYGSLKEIIPTCDSDWITILMQDDRLKPSHVAQVTELTARFPNAEAIWAGEDLITRNGSLLRKGIDSNRTELIEPGSEAWMGCLRRGCIWTISGSSTRRRLFLDVPFRSDLPHCGDYDWLLRAIRVSRFLYFERPLTEIRIHERQASAKNLHNGTDVSESYQILKANIVAHGSELAWKEKVRIFGRRSKLTGRRCIAALARGRIRHGWMMASYALRFLGLAMTSPR